MPLTFSLYDSDTLLGIVRNLRKDEPVSTYWLDLCFPNTVQSDDGWIDFSKVPYSRKMAPFVMPMEEGRPIMSQAERTFRVRPSYIRIKDPITADRMLVKQAGLGEIAPGSTALTPQQRYDANVAAIAMEHDKAIRRRWEWLAAKAVIDASVVIKNDDHPEAYPPVTVDFQRDPGHKIVKAAGSRWGDSGVDILKDIEDMISTVRNASYGGVVNRITVGRKVFDVMREDDKIRERMNLNYRTNLANEINITNRVLSGADVEYVGQVANGIPVVVYSDYTEDSAGNKVPMMADTDVVLTSPSVDGFRCFGAISDKRAGWKSLPIFMKMWDQEDPSATFITSASAPIMVPMNPNATLTATVVQ